MEVSGSVVRQSSCFFHRGSHDRSSTRPLSGVGTLANHRIFTPSCTAGTQRGVKNYVLCEEDHVQYYAGPACHGKSMEEKQKKKQKERVKKELKLLKGLSVDLSASSRMGFYAHSDEGKLVSKRAEELARQLQELKAEHKELKRKRKLEEAKRKSAGRMKTIHDSSSSSSESCDYEDRDVVDMGRRGKQATLLNTFSYGCQKETVEESTFSLPLLQSDRGEQNMNRGLDLQSSDWWGRNGGEGRGEEEEGGWRVEVCMGGKCRKAGGGKLLEEFERVVGVEGAVCGCKCMGKCRDGPNVRVVSCKGLAAPLCIGVGLEDVGRIAAARTQPF